MYQTIPVPAKGDGLRATWGAAVANGINALATMAPAGMLVREGVGCGAEQLPENRRNRTTKPNNGCYRIVSFEKDEDEEGEGVEENTAGTLTLGNCYYQIGGKTYAGAVSSIESVGPEKIVALKVTASGDVPSDSLIIVDDIEDLQEEQTDPNYYIFPLYKFDENMAVVCDFRNQPVMMMGEF